MSHEGGERNNNQNGNRYQPPGRPAPDFFCYRPTEVDDSIMLSRDQGGEGTCYYQDGIPLCICEFFKQASELE